MKASLALYAVTGVLVYGALALSAPAAKPVDKRPQAGTIACRDAQIAKVQTMVVNVQTDPFTRDYERGNRDVVEILEAAAELEALCR